MTPVREALEEWRLARQDIFANTNNISNENAERWRRLSNAEDALMKALSAAPGEPCAWNEVVADALDCFWNAAIGSAQQSQDATATAISGSLAEGFSAIATRLREHAVVASSPTTPQPAAGWDEARRGIYIASKTKHADRWRRLRDELACLDAPVISTWIDEAGEGESADLDDLWRRCIHEASHCRVLIVYREQDDVLKGGWVEVGAALAVGVPVYAVGLDGFTIAKYRGITHFSDMATAVAAAVKAIRREAPAPAEGVKPVVSIVPMELSDDRMDYFVSIKVGDREVTPHVFREEYKAAYHVALYDWLLNGTGEEPDCVEFGPKDWPARVMSTRPDTAETRLREALEQIKSSIDTRLNNVLCEMKPDYDDSIVGFNEAWDIVRKFLREKIESLSPPSGGDEAKESDLGCMADFSPGDPANLKELLASEPSPPADRREIVARTLSTKFPAILAQYSQYKIAEAILAALAQSDDASRKREG